jgi:carboxypeptidase C (cathepsin A)
VNNPYSWNSHANIMWVDQPSNVGYSYGKAVVDDDHDEAGVAEDMYSFLQEFFKAHPEYSDREFYVFGESYGGHYAPAISNRIFTGNNNKEGLYINLKVLHLQYSSIKCFCFAFALGSLNVRTAFARHSRGVRTAFARRLRGVRSGLA